MGEHDQPKPGDETASSPNQFTRRDYVRSSLGIGLPAVTGLNTNISQSVPGLKNAWFRLLANGNIKFLLQFDTNLTTLEDPIRPDNVLKVDGNVTFDDSITFGWYQPYTISEDEMRAQLEEDGLTQEEEEFLRKARENFVNSPSEVAGGEDPLNKLLKVFGASEFTQKGIIERSTAGSSGNQPLGSEITFPPINTSMDYVISGNVPCRVQMPDGFVYEYPAETIYYPHIDSSYHIVTNLSTAYIDLEDTRYEFSVPYTGDKGQLDEMIEEINHTINPTYSLLRASAQRRWLTLALITHTMAPSITEDLTKTAVENIKQEAADDVQRALETLAPTTPLQIGLYFGALAGVALGSAAFGLPAVWVAGETLITLGSFIRGTQKAAEALEDTDVYDNVTNAWGSVWIEEIVHAEQDDVDSKADKNLQTIAELAKLQAEYGTQALARSPSPHKIRGYRQLLAEQQTQLSKQLDALSDAEGMAYNIAPEQGDFVSRSRQTVRQLMETIQHEQELLENCIVDPDSREVTERTESTSTPTSTATPTPSFTSTPATTSTDTQEVSITGENPVSRWQFEQSLTDSVGNYDLSPNMSATSVSSIVSDQPTYTEQAREGQYAVNLDGVHLTRTGFYSLDPSEAWGIRFWMRDTDSMSSWDDDYIIQYVNHDGGGWGVSITTDGRPFIYTSGANTMDEGSTSVLDGNWHEVWFAHDQPNERMSLYIDQEREYSIPYTDTTQGGDMPTLHIGRMYEGAKDYNGLLDDVRFYTSTPAVD